jgi:SAM-dependent methyltransferase
MLRGAHLRAYLERGWCCVPGVFSPRAVETMREAVRELTDDSRHARAGNDAFNIERGHGPKTPLLQKIKRPHLWHPTFNRVVSDRRLLDVVEQLLHGSAVTDDGSGGTAPGGVRFHGDKIVIKAPHGVGRAVDTHQDWAFYPHTNDHLCTASVVLEDMSLERGGLLFVPGSHRGPVFSHHLTPPGGHGKGEGGCVSFGNFVGSIHDPRFDPNQVEWDSVACPAGTVIVHHARTIHCSPANASDLSRPLLLLQYAAGDAWPLQQHSRGAWGIDLPIDLPAEHGLRDDWEMYLRGLVRGQEQQPRMAAVPVSLPSPWHGRGMPDSLSTQLRAGTPEPLDVSVAHINHHCYHHDDDRRRQSGRQATTSAAARSLGSLGPPSTGDAAGAATASSAGGAPSDTPTTSAPNAAPGGGAAGGAYSPPSSGRQFATLHALRLSTDPVEWQRLLQFVGLGPYGMLAGGLQSQRLLQRVLARAIATAGASELAARDTARGGGDGDDATSGGDDDVYDALHECYWAQVVGSPDHARAAAWADQRSEARAREVVDLIQESQESPSSSASTSASVSSILDLGCADGQITARVGELLGLDAANVHGCDDLAAMNAGGETRHPGFAFRKLQASDDGRPRWGAGRGPAPAGSSAPAALPYADGSMDVVFSLMTLHHVRRQREMLGEVRRVLQPGGLFVFREHDCASEAMAGVLDVMHGLHHRSWAAADHPNYRARGWLQRNYRGHYQSAEAWHRSVTAAGLAPRRRGLRPFACDHAAVPVVDAVEGSSAGAPEREGAVVALRGAELRAFLRAQASSTDAAAGDQHVRFLNMKGVFFGVYVK